MICTETVDSLFKWNTFELDEKQQSINQSIIKARISVLQYFDFSRGKPIEVKVPERWNKKIKGRSVVNHVHLKTFKEHFTGENRCNGDWSRMDCEKNDRLKEVAT